MVIWIVGLSGAGKTTLSKEVIKKVRAKKKNVVLLDGDLIRETFENDIGHNLNDRYLNANRICRLSKFLDDQGIHVVCAILSLFPESRDWNRKNIKNYFEVFIKAPKNQLKERDYKGLYKQFFDGKIKNVAGLDLEFKEPSYSDLIIENNNTIDKLLSNANYLSELIIKSDP